MMWCRLVQMSIVGWMLVVLAFRDGFEYFAFPTRLTASKKRRTEMTKKEILSVTDAVLWG